MGIFAFGLERIGLVCLKAPRVTLAMLVAITAVALYGATRVELDDDLRKLFDSDRPIYQTYERFSAEFPAVENQILLLVEGAGLLERDTLTALRRLHLDLQFVDGVAGVVSMFSARSPPDEQGIARPLFPAELPRGDVLDSLIAELRGHPLLADKVLARDGTATLMVVSLANGADAYDRTEALLDDIDRLGTDLLGPHGVTVTATGIPALRHDILTSVRSDLHVLNLLGGIIAVMVCALFFRRPSLVFIASVPPLAAVAWTIGGLGLAGEPITAMNNVVPTLVLVIAFTDAMHMVYSVRRNLAAGASAMEAARRAVLHVGPACVMSVITTIIALLTLVFTDSAIIRLFGITGAIGMAAAYLAVITWIPVLTVVIAPSVAPAGTARQDSLFGRVAVSWSEAVTARVIAAAPTVAWTSAAVLLVTGWAYFQIEPRYDYRDYLAPSSPANQAIDRINDKLGGADALYVLIERKGGGQAEGDDPLSAVRQVHDAVMAAPAIGNAFSLASIADWVNRGRAATPVAMSDIAHALPEQYADRLVGRSGNAWLVAAYMPAAPAPETAARLRDLDRALDGVRVQHPGFDIAITGLIPVTALESGEMIAGLKRNLAAAVAIIIAVIGLAAGSPSLALLSLVPNLLSLTIVAAALYLIGSGFQFTSVVALTVAFGIAVDNTIHLIHRFRLEGGALAVDDALLGTARKVGPVLIAATAVLSLGMSVTQLSDLPMVRLFGMLSIVVLCTSLVATLAILPALVSLASRGTLWARARTRRS